MGNRQVGRKGVMPNHATVLSDGTYESDVADVDNKKISRTDATST